MTTTEAIWATGRRKTAIARVRLTPGSGKIAVNKRSLDEYFKGNTKHSMVAMQAIQVSKSTGFDIFVNVLGGGLTGQAEAIRHGIARALSKTDQKIKVQMRKIGYLTRDPRAVERKKPGQPKARKRFQYSKR